MFKTHGAEGKILGWELVLGIAALLVVSGMVFLTFNPSKQAAEIRNVQRRKDVETILSAVRQYALDHQGELPAGITEKATAVCRSGSIDCSPLLDLTVLVTGKYLTTLPSDPLVEAGKDSGYQIKKSSTGRVTVFAPKAEQSALISETR